MFIPFTVGPIYIKVETKVYKNFINYTQDYTYSMTDFKPLHLHLFYAIDPDTEGS